jgi:inosose dehydratase
MQSLNLEMVSIYSGADFVYLGILGEELAKIEMAAPLAAQFGATYLMIGGGAAQSIGTTGQDYQRLEQVLKKVIDLGIGLHW